MARWNVALFLPEPHGAEQVNMTGETSCFLPENVHMTQNRCAM